MMQISEQSGKLSVHLTIGIAWLLLSGCMGKSINTDKNSLSSTTKLHANVAPAVKKCLSLLAATQAISISKQLNVADISRILRQFGVELIAFQHYQMIGNDVFELNLTEGCLTNVTLVFSVRHRTLSVKLTLPDATIAEHDVRAVFSECRRVPKTGSHSIIHPPFYDLLLARESERITFIITAGGFISAIEISKSSIGQFPDTLQRMIEDGS